MATALLLMFSLAVAFCCGTAFLKCGGVVLESSGLHLLMVYDHSAWKHPQGTWLVRTQKAKSRKARAVKDAKDMKSMLGLR